MIDKTVIYYRDAFAHLRRLVMGLTLIIIVMVMILAFLVKTHISGDRFFAATNEGNTMQMVGLAYPNMGRTAVTSWVQQAVTQIMTFGFNDIDARFAVSQANFTPEGWISFRKAMINSGIITSMMKSQQILTSALKGPPTLAQEGLQLGVYMWAFDVDLLITVRSGAVQNTLTRQVRVVLHQVDPRYNPNALGIAEWYMF